MRRRLRRKRVAWKGPKHRELIARAARRDAAWEDRYPGQRPRGKKR